MTVFEKLELIRDGKGAVIKPRDAEKILIVLGSIGIVYEALQVTGTQLMDNLKGLYPEPKDGH